MPIYLMRCQECGKEQDIFRSVAKMDDDLPVCHGPMKHVICAPMVTPDIQPYMAVAVDKHTGKRPYITSRKQHREFLRRNGYAEVGNEKNWGKKRPVKGDFNLRKELTEATRQVLNK